MHIGTWNVEYALGADTNRRRRDVMRRFSADIWILTETRDTLKPGVGFIAAHSVQRPYFGISVRHRSRWVSIWSRYPMRRVHVRGADRERTVFAHITTPLGPLAVFGTVLPWRGDTKRVIDEAVADQMVSLGRLAWKGAPICFAGDFNTDMRSGTNYLTHRSFEMIGRALKRNGLFCATGPHLPRRHSLSAPPIDHIALPITWRKRAHVVAAWEGKVGSPRMTDHSGLVVEVR